MILKRILPYSKFLLQEVVSSGDVVVDATAGNGHDTLFLSELVGESGAVYSFDIQEEALHSTQQKLNERNIENVTLIHDGHQHVKNYLNQEISAAIFNLGYLPGANHEITTEGETTLTAIHELLTLLKSNGLIVLVVYHGHEQGKLEKNFLLTELQKLSQKEVNVLQYQYLNQVGDAPFIIAIEKLR